MNKKYKYTVVEFTKNIFLTGEEIDWEIVGGCIDVYAMIMAGDKMAVGGFASDVERGEFMTYNHNAPDDSDGAMSLIVFRHVPKDAFKILPDKITYDEATKLRDWKTFIYNHRDIPKATKGLTFVKNTTPKDNN